MFVTLPLPASPFQSSARTPCSKFTLPDQISLLYCPAHTLTMHWCGSGHVRQQTASPLNLWAHKGCLLCLCTDVDWRRSTASRRVLSLPGEQGVYDVVGQDVLGVHTLAHGRKLLQRVPLRQPLPHLLQVRRSSRHLKATLTTSDTHHIWLIHLTHFSSVLLLTRR